MNGAERAPMEGVAIPDVSREALDTIARRQAQLARNFIEGIEPYLGGEEYEGVTLRTHQPPALRELQDLFRETEMTPDRRILWTSPPNFGKSTMSALTVREAGIGRPMPDGSRPLQAVTLVPRTVARRQIMDTCAWMAPRVKTRSFMARDGQGAIDHADMLVMTYYAALGLNETEWDYIAARTDLWLLDEVHRGLGGQISVRVLSAMDRYKPTVVALSATPDFSEDRSTAKILKIDRSITSMTPREAAETGVANGVQLLALQTGVDIRFSSNGAEIGERELAPLIIHKPRNKLIVSIMRDMGNLGVRGLVHCVPGAQNAHAELIAQYARSQYIKDPNTGEIRPMRVEAVGKHKQSNDVLIQLFKEGKLDALTFSKYLVEAFDDSNVRYIVAAAPTSSAVDMGQLVGRGARLGNSRITKLFCLIDHYSSSSQKLLQTPFHVFGAGNFRQGEVVAPKTSWIAPRQQKHQPTKKGSRMPAETVYNDLQDDIYAGLSEETRAAMRDIPPGTILDQLLITRINLHNAPPGYTLLANTPAILDKYVSPNGARYILDGHLGSDGQPLIMNIAEHAYVSAEAETILNERHVFARKVSRLAIQNFLVDQGWPVMSFDGFVTACREAEVMFKVVGKVARLDANATAKMLYKLAETPLVDPDKEVHLTSLVPALRVTKSSTLLKVIQKEKHLSEHMYERRRGWQQGGYPPVKVMSIAGAVMLAETCLRRWSARAAVIGKTASEIVQEARQPYSQYVLERKLHPVLSRAAIDEFVRMFEPTGDASDVPQETTMASRKAEPLVMHAKFSEPPSPLIAGYRLSNHGAQWSDHANCLTSDADMFVEKWDKTVTKEALRICRGCPVKADCLLFSLKTESEGTAGGLRHFERAKLLPITSVIEDWLRQTKNSATSLNPTT